MRHFEKSSVYDLCLHYNYRQEIALGRGELLQVLAASLEDRDPSTARALSCVSDQMITEARATMEELQVMADAARSGLLTGQLAIVLYGHDVRAEPDGTQE